MIGIDLVRKSTNPYIYIKNSEEPQNCSFKVLEQLHGSSNLLFHIMLDLTEFFNKFKMKLNSTFFIIN